MSAVNAGRKLESRGFTDGLLPTADFGLSERNATPTKRCERQSWDWAILPKPSTLNLVISGFYRRLADSVVWRSKFGESQSI
jgi:hypothetical protein